MEGVKVGKPTSSISLTKVFFSIDAESWHGYSTESVWAERVSDRRYRIRNTPFFAKGVSFEDIVFVQEHDGNLVFEATSIAAGHSTYRILFEKSVSDVKFSRYWQPLENIGCSYESADRESMFLLAVDVPPDADINAVYRLLDKGEKDGIWSFEEGHCGHVV